MLHTLKVKKEYADEIIWGNKTFELRKNDRNYRQGDIVEFVVIDTDEEGRIVAPLDHPILRKHYEITYVLDRAPQYGLEPRFCIFGIRDLTVPDDWDRIDTQIHEISQAVAKMREVIVKHKD